MPFLIIGIVLVVAVTLANNADGGASMDLSVLTPGLAIKLILVGMVAISAMFLPGISGSTMLLIFGAYMPVMSSPLRKTMAGEAQPYPRHPNFHLRHHPWSRSCGEIDSDLPRKVPPPDRLPVLGMMVGSFYSIVMGPTTLEMPSPP